MFNIFEAIIAVAAFVMVIFLVVVSFKLIWKILKFAWTTPPAKEEVVKESPWNDHHDDHKVWY